MPTPHTSCRICGNTTLIPILSLGNQTLTGVFPRTREEEITTGPLELVKCHGDNACSLLQLAHSYDSKEMYGLNYGYRSGLNQSMIDHLRTKVGKLLGQVTLSSNDILLDIGSNDGTLLSFYPKEFGIVGMDPSAEKFRQFYQPHIQIVPDFFSADLFRKKTGKVKAKIITSIAMLYDLENPISFVEQIGSILAEDGVWHFEQSYMPSMLKANAYDTICHEHLEYYGLSQIKWMLDRCGLKIVDVELNNVNGGSFEVTAALVASPVRENTEKVESLLEMEEREGLAGLAPYERFSEAVYEHRNNLCAKLADITASGKKILGYGASTKGNVILQFCEITPAMISHIAEVNPDKFGSFTPGTSIPIISEEEAHSMNPDYFLVLPWHFRDNLVARESDFLSAGGKLLFPLPRIETVSK